jgi:hypothetical protein
MTIATTTSSAELPQAFDTKDFSWKKQRYKKDPNPNPNCQIVMISSSM